MAVNSVTYSALTTLIANNSLVVGDEYKITDYETIVGSGYTSVGNTFRLKVKALTTATLYDDASVWLDDETYFTETAVADWKVKYSVENNTTKYTWASASGKGVIYYLCDEKNNEAFFDFKNVQVSSKYLFHLSTDNSDYSMNANCVDNSYLYADEYTGNLTIGDIHLLSNSYNKIIYNRLVGSVSGTILGGGTTENDEHACYNYVENSTGVSIDGHNNEIANVTTLTLTSDGAEISNSTNIDCSGSFITVKNSSDVTGSNLTDLYVENCDTIDLSSVSDAYIANCDTVDLSSVSGVDVQVSSDITIATGSNLAFVGSDTIDLENVSDSNFSGCSDFSSTANATSIVGVNADRATTIVFDTAIENGIAIAPAVSSVTLGSDYSTKYGSDTNVALTFNNGNNIVASGKEQNTIDSTGTIATDTNAYVTADKLTTKKTTTPTATPTIVPNVLYDFGTLTADFSVTLSNGTYSATDYREWLFEFNSGSGSYSVSLPLTMPDGTSIEWQNIPSSILASKRYQVSIVDNCGLICGFSGTN